MIPAPSDPLTSDNQTAVEYRAGRPSDPGGDHISDIIELLLKTKTINFPGSRKVELQYIRKIGGMGILHAEAQMKDGGGARTAISVGPRYGPVTVQQLMEAIYAAQWDYNLLILAGFTFDPEVQAFIQKNPHPRLNLQLAYISPDVLVTDLLKTPRGSQIFTVFGQPDIDIKKNDNNESFVELKGVDIYDPITGKTNQSQGEDVAAWFLDTDYDGYTFRISQAFFPSPATSKNPWDKLENALRGTIDVNKMDQFRKTISIPFKSGDNNKIAVKVVDHRGNEVIAIMDLNDRG